jgi:hypothetical protein
MIAAGNKYTSVLIIEVGNLKRGETWRLSIDHINNLGKFGNQDNLDYSRPQKLAVKLQSTPSVRRGEILIACQHQGKPSMARHACYERLGIRHNF